MSLYHLEAIPTSIFTGTSDKSDAEYQAYVLAQIKKSYFLMKQSSSGPPLNERTVYLVGLMERVLPKSRDGFTVLCVGCRNSQELDYIEKSCQVKVEGLDLFSEDPRIKVGDMHRMPFHDNQFDCLYSCHSLEHAYDINVVLKEFVRVTKLGGMLVIEVPVKYQVCETDRWDVVSTVKLLEYLENSVNKVLIQEDAGDVARLLVTVKKQFQPNPSVGASPERPLQKLRQNAMKSG